MPAEVEAQPLSEVAEVGVQPPTEAPEVAPPVLAEGELRAEVEGPLLDQALATRRQYARFLVGGKAKGRITAIYDALVLDISMGGSLIEHAYVVRPGTLSSLDLDLSGKRLSLRCRVTRSVVHRSEVLPNGERELIYHTGLHFIDPPDEARRILSNYIQSMIKGSS
jgi:hypothetical protein